MFFLVFLKDPNRKDWFEGRQKLPIFLEVEVTNHMERSVTGMKRLVRGKTRITHFFWKWRL